MVSPITIHTSAAKDKKMPKRLDFVTKKHEQIQEEKDASVASNWQSSHSSSYISNFEYDDDKPSA